MCDGTIEDFEQDPPLVLNRKITSCIDNVLGLEFHDSI